MNEHAPLLNTISLYQTMLAAPSSSPSIRISSKSFRALLTGVLHFLRHRQVQASIWVKLPSRPSWQAILDHHLQKSPVALHVYRLERALDELPRPRSLVPPTAAAVPVALRESRHATEPWSVLSDFDDAALVDDDGMISSTGHPLQKDVVIPLLANVHLAREYFILVISEEFSGIFLAHRPRSIHARTPDALPPDGLPVSTEPDLEHGDRQSRLLTLCSFQPDVLSLILGRLHQVVQTSLYYQANPAAEMVTLLQTWPEQVATCQAAQSDGETLSHLFVHQVLQYELLVSQLNRQDRSTQQLRKVELENEKLRRTVQLKADFLNRTSQELKPPITNMKTALKLLTSPTLSDPQRQRYITMLSQACDRQNSVLTGVVELIQLEQIDVSQPGPAIYLHDAIPGLVSTYQPLATERGVSLAYTIPETLPAVQCPASWLQHILVSLLHNSLHFTPSGGKVWVTTHVANLESDRTVCLSVRDTGVGIHGSDLPHIFEAFYRGRHATTNLNSEGAGLGLTAVQQLLTRCGGTIAVQSQPGKGATFEVHLPIPTPPVEN